MLKPVGKRILVKPVEVEQGALIISGQKPVLFHVIAIGEEVTKAVPCDIVYIERHYGIELECGKEKYLVVDESSILAKLD